MAGDGLHTCLSPPSAEARDLVGRMRRRAPHPRALREHLHRVPADLLDAVDRLRDAPGRGDVGAEEHASTLLGRCPSASAWPRRPPASSTSAACARSSSTGSSRAGAAASASSGSRTRTRAARSPSPSSRSSARCAGSGSSGTERRRSSSMSWSARRRKRAASSPKDRPTRTKGPIRIRMPDEGCDRLGRRDQGADRGPERRARGPRARALGRQADVQLRVAARGLARRHHARHPRRRPRLEHAEAAQRAARARR